MPVRWSPDNDRLLLLKLLETHDITVDTKKISAAWPEDQGEIPTPRAISERLIKIRQNARNNGAGNFNIASARSKASSENPSTPRKKKTQPASSTPEKVSAPNGKKQNSVLSRSLKRKRDSNVQLDEAVGEDDSDTEVNVKEEADSIGITNGYDGQDDKYMLNYGNYNDSDNDDEDDYDDVA